jgi:hypothetical protein
LHAARGRKDGEPLSPTPARACTCTRSADRVIILGILGCLSFFSPLSSIQLGFNPYLWPSPLAQQAARIGHCHLQPPPPAAAGHHSGEFPVIFQKKKKKKRKKEKKKKKKERNQKRPKLPTKEAIVAHKRGRSCPPKEAKVAHFIFLALSWLVGP